jgi:caffeoyl-CoA O-methyltransferase
MADKDSREGLRYAVAEITGYVDDVHAGHDEALQAAFAAPDAQGFPAIQVGRSEGRTLELLMRLVGARKVVEVGTLTGYSAIRLARGMEAGGKLWTIEFDASHASEARARVSQANLSVDVEVVEGAGVDILPTLEEHGPFDAVFIDADKESYHQYGRWAAAHLRQGGLLIGDNAYLFGNLMEDSARAKAMRSFHEEAAQAFDSVCLPTPDGMLLGMKR